MECYHYHHHYYYSVQSTVKKKSRNGEIGIITSSNARPPTMRLSGMDMPRSTSIYRETWYRYIIYDFNLPLVHIP